MEMLSKAVRENKVNMKGNRGVGGRRLLLLCVSIYEKWIKKKNL